MPIGHILDHEANLERYSQVYTIRIRTLSHTIEHGRISFTAKYFAKDNCSAREATTNITKHIYLIVGIIKIN